MNKIKTVFFLLVISLFINPVSAQLLWKVEGNGLQQASYLYGTMHILCPDDFHIAEQVLKAYQNTDASCWSSIPQTLQCWPKCNSCR